jgi:hypothetical protein
MRSLEEESTRRLPITFLRDKTPKVGVCALLRGLAPAHELLEGDPTPDGGEQHEGKAGWPPLGRPA